MLIVRILRAARALALRAKGSNEVTRTLQKGGLRIGLNAILCKPGFCFQAAERNQHVHDKKIPEPPKIPEKSRAK